VEIRSGEAASRAACFPQLKSLHDVAAGDKLRRHVDALPGMEWVIGRNQTPLVRDQAVSRSAPVLTPSGKADEARQIVYRHPVTPAWRRSRAGCATIMLSCGPAVDEAARRVKFWSMVATD